MNKDPLDPDGIDIAARFIEEMGCTIFYGGWVQKIHSTNEKTRKQVLFVTEGFITYVKDPKSPELSHQSFWSTLFKFDIINKTRIELHFKTVNNELFKFRFISTESEIITRKIFDILLHEMTPAELAPLQLNRYPHPRISINPRGVLARFDQHLLRFSLNPHDVKFREILKNYLQNPHPDFFIEPFEHFLPVMKHALYAIIGSSWTRAFFFPKITDKDQVYVLYRFIGYFAKLPSHVNFIQFQSPIKKKIEIIINTFKGNTQSSINGIGYANVTMSDENVEKVKELILAKPFNTLRWCNIEPLTSVEDIVSDERIQECLKYLAVDNSKGLNLAGFASQLQNISVLSLQDCDLEIVDVFEIIEQNHLKVKMLNLTSNIAKRPFGEAICIPSSLQRIDISRVRFANNVMANIVEVLISNKYDNGIRFYCDKYYIVNPKEENTTLDNFGNIDGYDLVDFSWRKNKVSNKLLEFLSRCPNLEKLFFEGSISNKGEDKLVDELLSIFPRLRNLTHLYIRGSKSFKLGDDFNDDFLTGLEEIPKLRFLDISNNDITEESIDSLSKWLRDIPDLSYIVLDGNDIHSLEPVKHLANTAINIHRKVFVSFPVETVTDLLYDHKATEDEVDELVEVLKNASSSNKGSPIVCMKRRNTYNLDSEVSTDSVEFSTRSHSFRRSRRTTESLFVNEGHAQKNKKNLLSEYEYQQDPESIFIHTFDKWTADIDEDNVFPRYMTKELEKELEEQKDLINPERKISKYVSMGLFEYNETMKRKLTISPSASTSSADFLDFFEREEYSPDDFPISPLARNIPKQPFEEEEEKPEEPPQKEIVIEEEEEKFEEKVVEEEEEEKHEEEERIEEEEFVEQMHEEEEIFEEEEEVQTIIIKKKKPKPAIIITVSESESEEQSEPDSEPDNIIEAVPFQAPSWCFPIPRPERPSNKEFVKEMSQMLSAKTVINALKTSK